MEVSYRQNLDQCHEVGDDDSVVGEGALIAEKAAAEGVTWWQTVRVSLSQRASQLV